MIDAVSLNRRQLVNLREEVEAHPKTAHVVLVQESSGGEVRARLWSPSNRVLRDVVLGVRGRVEPFRGTPLR